MRRSLLGVLALLVGAPVAMIAPRSVEGPTRVRQQTQDACVVSALDVVEVLPQVRANVAMTGCPELNLTATVRNLTDKKRAQFQTNESSFAWKFSPCQGGRGSDLPGDVVAVKIDPFDATGTLTGSLTLGPDTTHPVAKLDSEPPPGARVRAGDRIQVLADGTSGDDARDGATSWQTGVQTLQVIAGGGRVHSVESGRRSPEPCGSKRLQLDKDVRYKVTKGDGPVLQLCAVAEDYVGLDSGATGCREYYLGEVWKGPLQGTVSPQGCTSARVNGTMTLAVDAKGKVAGTYEFSYPSYTCGPATVPPLSISDQVTGTKTGSSFSLTLHGPGPAQLELHASRGRARGSYDFLRGGAGSVSADLECKTCGEA
jgi:hypothetical protein